MTLTHHDDLEQFLNENLVKQFDQHVCSICGKAGISAKDIKKHIEAKHVILPPRVCQQCGKQFKTRESLRKHELSSHPAVLTQDLYH